MLRSPSANLFFPNSHENATLPRGVDSVFVNSADFQSPRRISASSEYLEMLQFVGCRCSPCKESERLSFLKGFEYLKLDFHSRISPFAGEIVIRPGKLEEQIQPQICAPGQ